MAVPVVVATLKVEVPGGVSELGLKLQVVVLGQPLMLRPTVPAKPFSTVPVTV